MIGNLLVGPEPYNLSLGLDLYWVGRRLVIINIASTPCSLKGNIVAATFDALALNIGAKGYHHSM